MYDTNNILDPETFQKTQAPVKRKDNSPEKMEEDNRYQNMLNSKG